MNGLLKFGLFKNLELRLATIHSNETMVSRG